MNSFKMIENGTPISVAIINLPNALASSLIGIQDVFNIANNFCIDPNTDRRFDITLLHSQKECQNFNSSLTINSTKIKDEDSFDIVIIPPIIDTGESLQAPQELLLWLNKMYKKGSYISSVCAGAYILAQSGLLDNKKATSHWIIESKLAHDFPKIDLKIDKIIIEDQNIITAGGVSAYFDLALYFIRKYISIQASYQCANFLIVDAGRTSQKHYKDLASLSTVCDAKISTLISWMESNYHYPISAVDLSQQLQVAERTLTRKFLQETGTTPTKYLQKIRVQKAKDLLINSNETFEKITALVGYEDISSFRRLFKKMTGLTPSEYQKLFMAK